MMMSLRLGKQLSMSEAEGGGMLQRLLQLPLTADKKQTQPKSDDENKWNATPLIKFSFSLGPFSLSLSLRLLAPFPFPRNCNISNAPWNSRVARRSTTRDSGAAVGVFNVSISGAWKWAKCLHKNHSAPQKRVKRAIVKRELRIERSDATASTLQLQFLFGWFVFPLGHRLVIVMGPKLFSCYTQWHRTS